MVPVCERNGFGFWHGSKTEAVYCAFSFKVKDLEGLTNLALSFFVFKTVGLPNLACWLVDFTVKASLIYKPLIDEGSLPGSLKTSKGLVFGGLPGAPP